MKLYFAPMEGIAVYTYRNTHAEIFGGCDEYFAPFIVPTENEKISRKTLRDILPENNIVNLRPQVLCSNPEAFVQFAQRIKYLDYNELNFNLGCPSGTVVKKNRGAGALRDTDGLEKFFDYIFSNCDAKISVKTRAGFESHEEFDRLLEVYNKYPVDELIVHPRVRAEYYNGLSNLQTFDKAYNNSLLKLCYNGDICTVSDYNKIEKTYPRLNGIMIGRGAVANPAIFREIRGGDGLKTEELLDFSKKLEERYLKLLGSEKYTLHKLKEIWIYMMLNYPDEKKILKAVKKANKLFELNAAINCLPCEVCHNEQN